MTERRRAQAGTDLVSWSCRTCKTTRSIRDRSFFSGSKLTLQQWMIAILWWSREYPVTEMALEASITEETAGSPEVIGPRSQEIVGGLTGNDVKRYFGVLPSQLLSPSYARSPLVSYCFRV